MATLLHSESRRLYSWWWDSHISPKNSKWLQDNLTDMDAKVKSMIKLIEEDADSFARRAEMYYKKRPELMKLVEEFYRAYRALAERYNHATGELRHAHRTIAKAFPDQVPFELGEDSPSKSRDGDPHTPETNSLVRALFDEDGFIDDAQGLSESDPLSLKKTGPRGEDSEGGMRRRGLKQLHEIVGAIEAATQGSKSAERKVLKVSQEKEMEDLSNENQNLKDKVLHESERAGKAESEVQGLKKALSDMKAEKDDVLLKYQRCLEKLSSIEEELENAQKDSMMFNEKASRAEIEVQTLKEDLAQLETEKNAGLVKHQMCLDKISNLEATLSQVQEDKKVIENKAVEAETDALAFGDEISRLKLEKEAMDLLYKQCLGKISDLENLISINEDEAKLLKMRAEIAETEVSELKKALADLHKEKEASAIRYKCCLETIAKLEKDLSIANENVNRLKKEVSVENSKLKTAEEKCSLLELSNQSLRGEADDLAKRIAMKNQELSEKQEEMEKFQSYLQDEKSRHAEIEATLQNLQALHSQSQDDQRALASELKKLLQVLNELEISKNGLEDEIRMARDENENLSQMNLSTAVCMDNMQNEILSLRDIKEKLEKEVLQHMGLSDSLQQEISSLKEEIKCLNSSYKALVEQVEAAGLSPNSFSAEIIILKDENSNLRRICEEGDNEKQILSEKLEKMAEVLKEKVLLESSVSDLNDELEGSRERMKEMQESFQSFHDEKATLVAEKASLLSQLLAMTENMHKLLEKNAVLENSLSSAKVELEGLRERSKGLEEICELLKNEKSYILSERSSLALKLEQVESRLEALEKRFMGLEEKCVGLEKEKEAMHFQFEELKLSLGIEKQERTSSQLENETRMAGLQNQIHLLQEENKWKKKEFEDELEKALKAQFEISILQKFMKDMEEKNYSLIIECQKHVEASKLAEKLISELESETLEQQVESELLLDEIERLRLGIYQIFRALETGPTDEFEEKVENDRTFVHHILGIIEDMKCSISEYEDDKQLLLVENSVLLALLEELESKGKEIELQKMYLEKEFKIMDEKLSMVESEKEKLLEMNTKLKSDVSGAHQHSSALEAELRSLGLKQAGLHEAYSALQREYSQVNRDNEYLLKKFSDLKEEKSEVDKHNDSLLLQCLASENQSIALRSFGAEKIIELKLLLKDLNRQQEVNKDLENEMSVLKEKLDLQKAENCLLKDAVHRLEGEILGIRESNVQLKQDMLSRKESLLEAERKLFDAHVKLEAVEKLNSNLSGTVDELKIDIQESHLVRENLEKDVFQLSKNISIQEKEIESLHLVNTNLESELGLLREEIQEKTVNEQILSSELQDKNNEFELWEAEATAFYFDLQISSIREVLFQNKVQELTGVCKSLEKDRDSKLSEIEEMKRRMSSMESEIGGLKSQIGAYAPIIASLRDDITFIEHNALQTKLKAAHHEEPEEVAARPSTSTFDVPMEDETLISLQNLQSRVKAVGKLMEEMNKPVLSRRSNSIRKQEPELSEIEPIKPRRSLGRDHSRKKGLGNELSETPRLKIKTKASEARIGVLMKDIPLDSNSSRRGLRKKGKAGSDDQMLELWETAEDGQTIGESLRMSYKMTEKDIVYDQFHENRKSDPPSTDSDVERELAVDKLELSTRFSEPSRENDKIILERLSSDARRLESLQNTVQTLRKKLETNKKGRKVKTVDFETVDEQLLEAEETVVNLVNLNDQLVKDIEECPSPDGRASPKMKEVVKMKRKKVTERARKGSERIGRLQLELQKIQYILMKMEDEKNKGRNKFLKGKTIILRDFILNGRKNSLRRKKGCGCFRPSTSRNGRSSP